MVPIAEQPVTRAVRTYEEATPAQSSDILEPVISEHHK